MTLRALTCNFPLRGENQERDGMPVAGDAERPVPDARGHVARRSKGKP
jgi:hypothetical protein